MFIKTNHIANTRLELQNGYFDFINRININIYTRMRDRGKNYLYSLLFIYLFILLTNSVIRSPQ